MIFLRLLQMLLLLLILLLLLLLLLLLTQHVFLMLMRILNMVSQC